MNPENKLRKFRIGLIGGGTGGHFYPLIAVAESLRQKLPEADLLFFNPELYNKEEVDRLDIHHIHISAGKLRSYLS